MKKYTLILLIATLLVSCSKNEENYLSDKSPGSYSIQEESHQRTFAKTLSKAVYGNSNLRKFIREEALRQFDNDYDVFYPLLKNEIVSGDSTFRDILLSYADDKELFSQMETEMPMLNILVPDWSWITGFSAESWDISDPEVAVSYADDNDSHIIFGDGEEIGSFKTGEYPGLPVLVVKNNERLRKRSGDSDAKSFLGEYEFIDEAFDGLYQPQKRVASQYYDINIPSEETNRFVPASELDPLLIGAYDLYKDSLSSAHRDYVYYNGNTNTQSPRTINKNIYERLYKIRIHPDAYYRLSYQQYGDPHLTNVSHKKKALSTEEILNRIWTEGNYEMMLEIILRKVDGANESKEITLSISPKDLFDVSTIHVDYKHGTWFTKAKYIYRVGADDLKPKWYVINQPNAYFMHWDLSEYSNTIFIDIYECDPNRTETKTETLQNSFTYKTTDEGNEVTAYNTFTRSYQRTIYGGNIYLGGRSCHYSDRIVMSETTLNGIKGYNINYTDIGYVDLLLLPFQKN